MNVNVKTHTLTDLFRKEWKLYVEDVPKAGVVHKVEMAKHSDSFSRNPKVGEIRLVADVEPPYCVFLNKKLEDGWDIVPISPFHNPATSCEALIGRHVYQAWNRQKVDQVRIARSWLVEPVPVDERKEICAVLDFVEKDKELPDYLKPAMGEPVRSSDDPRLRYLSDFSTELSELKFTNLGVEGRPQRRRGVRLAVFPHRIRPNWYRPMVNEHEWAAAAAVGTGSRSLALFMSSPPRTQSAFKEQAFECVLQSEPMSLLPGDDERDPLVYTWEQPTPESWRRGKLQVAAYVDKTGALFGRGTIDVVKKRIVINDFKGLKLKTALERVSDIVLVVTPAEETRK